MQRNSISAADLGQAEHNTASLDLGLMAFPAVPGQAAKFVERPAASERSGEAGPPLCITGAKTSQDETGGFDTSNVCLAVVWGNREFQAVRAVLEEGRETAQKLEQPIPLTLPGLDGDERVYIEPYGARRGGRSCRWVLTWQGCEIAVCDSLGDGEHFNVFFRHGSAKLMASGLLGTHTDLLAIVKAMGGEVAGESVSRADICVDLAGEEVDTLAKILQTHLVCRAHGKSVNYGKGFKANCVTIGQRGAKVYLRMYDKVQELKAHPDPVKEQLLIERRWGGEKPEAAMRVEFELRGELLRRFNIRTVAELAERVNEVSHWLLVAWIRFAAEEVDRENNHQSRASELHPLWEKTCAAFAAWCGQVQAFREVPAKLGQVNAKMRARAVNGYIAGWVAKLGKAFDTVEEAFAFMLEECRDQFADFCDVVEIKRHGLERAGPGVYIPAAEIPF